MTYMLTECFFGLTIWFLFPGDVLACASSQGFNATLSLLPALVYLPGCQGRMAGCLSGWQFAQVMGLATVATFSIYRRMVPSKWPKTPECLRIDRKLVLVSEVCQMNFDQSSRLKTWKWAKWITHNMSSLSCDEIVDLASTLHVERWNDSLLYLFVFDDCYLYFLPQDFITIDLAMFKWYLFVWRCFPPCSKTRNRYSTTRVTCHDHLAEVHSRVLDSSDVRQISVCSKVMGLGL